MDNIAIENFINFCDDMQIVEEGFSVKKLGSDLLKFVKTIWSKFVEFIRKIKKWVSVKFGKDRVKPKDEIARLERELAELKRTSNDTINRQNNMIDRLTKETSSLKQQRSYLANQSHSLNSDNADKEQKIKELEGDIRAMKRAECEMQYLDADIHNYIKITSGDIECCEEELKDLQKLISDISKNPNGEFDVRDTQLRKLSFKSDKQKQYLEEINKRFDRYKDCIKDVRYSYTGRFQNFFLYQNIELITSRINLFEKCKKQLELCIPMVDRLPDDCKYKTSLNNIIQNMTTQWTTKIQKCQMLINKLVELTNGSINDVF